MDIEINELLQRFALETATLVQRAIVAETQRDMLAKKLEEATNGSDSTDRDGAE